VNNPKEDYEAAKVSGGPFMVSSIVFLSVGVGVPVLFVGALCAICSALAEDEWGIDDDDVEEEARAGGGGGSRVSV
jgi:hypothetical protein